MAKFDLSTIAEPISEEEPCGPDLDDEFDTDFMNFMAQVEGSLPASYFSFDPSSFGFDGYFDTIDELLTRTRDLRLLVMMAKLRILKGDLAGFCDAIGAMRDLLKAHWADVHPKAMDGDYGLRLGYLFTLDDNPNSLLPLQHTTLASSRRYGNITLRKWQLANGDVKPREGEEKPDGEAIKAGLAEAEAAELEAVTAKLMAASEALAEIQKIAIEEAGFENAVNLEKVPDSISTMLSLIGMATGADVGEEGEEGEDGAVVGSVVLPSGSVKNRVHVKRALHIAARYFALNEPSNPAAVLLREAEAAIEKEFFSLVTDMVPSKASAAIVKLGAGAFFELSLPELNKRNPAPNYAAEVEAELNVANEDSGVDDPESVSEEAGEAGDSESADDSEGGDAAAEQDTSDSESGRESEGEPADDAGEVEDAEPDVEAETAGEPEAEKEPEAEPKPEPVSESEPQFWANSRPEAVALMESVIAYYKVAEPTSPVPLLVERAVAVCSRSFMDLLMDVLPEGSLKVPK